MRTNSKLLCGVAVLALCTAGPSAWAARCPGATTSEVRSLAKLPTALRDSLHPRGSQANDIAERGARFNATDVAIQGVLRGASHWLQLPPSVRLSPLSMGGIAHGFQLTEWQLNGAVWKSIAHVIVLHEPTSLTDLLAW